MGTEVDVQLGEVTYPRLTSQVSSRGGTRTWVSPSCSPLSHSMYCHVLPVASFMCASSFAYILYKAFEGDNWPELKSLCNEPSILHVEVKGMSELQSLCAVSQEDQGVAALLTDGLRNLRRKVPLHPGLLAAA